LLENKVIEIRYHNNRFQKNARAGIGNAELSGTKGRETPMQGGDFRSNVCSRRRRQRGNHRQVCSAWNTCPVN
jgi:hypothetical protein